MEPLDYETATRSFEITVDESDDQTGRIVRRELDQQALDGFREKLATGRS